MADPLWNSLDRLSQISRVAAATAFVSLSVSAVAWIWPLTTLAATTAIVGTVAVLVAMFAWFRADDLARGAPRR